MFCGPDGLGYCDPYAYPPGFDYGPTNIPAPPEHVWENFDDFCEFPFNFCRYYSTLPEPPDRSSQLWHRAS